MFLTPMTDKYMDKFSLVLAHGYARYCLHPSAADPSLIFSQAGFLTVDKCMVQSGGSAQKSSNLNQDQIFSY